MKYFVAICLLACLIASCFAASISPDSTETKTSVLFHKLHKPAAEMPDAKREGRNYGGWGGYGGYGGGWGGGYGGGWGGWGR